jgi:hypothetical protein
LSINPKSAEDTFTKGKETGDEDYPSTPSTAVVKNSEATLALHSRYSWRGAYLVKSSDFIYIFYVLIAI